jgi:tripartite ATP-independent transporter DctP family solute receptor
MRKKSKRVSWFILITAFLIFGPMAIGASALELKYAHTMSPTDTMHQAVLKFAELVKAKSGGVLEINVYPAGQLGNDPQILQAVRLGSIDIAMTGIPWHASFAPYINVLDLPYLFSDYNHAYHVLDGEIGQELLKQLEPLGIKGLGTMELGFRNLTNSKRSVKEPKDVEGLKLRTTGNYYHIAAWKLLGTIPIPMPWPEVYMALKTGTVDGQENPITVIHAAKLFEVQKYLSLTMHAYSVSGVDMNLKKFQSLAPSQQKILIESLYEAVVYHRNLNRSLESSMLKEMEQKGMAIIANPYKEAFAKIVRKVVQEEYAKQFGWEIIDKINKVK